MKRLACLVSLLLLCGCGTPPRLSMPWRASSAPAISSESLRFIWQPRVQMWKRGRLATSGRYSPRRASVGSAGRRGAADVGHEDPRVVLADDHGGSMGARGGVGLAGIAVAAPREQRERAAVRGAGDADGDEDGATS